MKSSKILSVVLAAAMCLTMLAACSGGTSDSESSSAAASSSEASSSESSEESSDSSTAAESSEPSSTAEPAEVSIKTYHATWTAPDDFSSTVVGAQTLEKLNIKVVVLQNSTGDSEADLATDLAADDLASISINWSSNYMQMSPAAHEGRFADLTSYLTDTDAPIILEWLNYQDLNIGVKNILSTVNDTGIYMLPTNFCLDSVWVSGYGLYIREDIANQLGIAIDGTAITDMDSLISILKQIKEQHFTDTSGNNEVYPLGFKAMWSSRGFWLPYTYGDMYRNFKITEDGKVENWFETDYPYQEIDLMQSLIAQDLIDVELFTNTGDGDEKVATGRYAVMGGFSEMTTSADAAVASLISENPEMAYRPLGRVNNMDGSRTVTLNTGSNNALSLWVAHDADAAACVKLIEYFSTLEGNTLNKWGTPDMYEIDSNNQISLKEEYLNEKAADSNAFNVKYGTNYINGVVTGGGGTMLSSADKYTYQPKLTESDQELIDIRNAIMPEYTVVNKIDINSRISMYSDYETIKMVLDKKEDTLNQAFLASSTEEGYAIWDAYVENLKNAGLDQLVEFLQSEYDADPDSYLIGDQNE